MAGLHPGLNRQPRAGPSRSPLPGPRLHTLVLRRGGARSGRRSWNRLSVPRRFGCRWCVLGGGGSGCTAGRGCPGRLFRRPSSGRCGVPGNSWRRYRSRRILYRARLARPAAVWWRGVCCASAIAARSCGCRSPAGCWRRQARRTNSSGVRGAPSASFPPFLRRLGSSGGSARSVVQARLRGDTHLCGRRGLGEVPAGEHLFYARDQL